MTRQELQAVVDNPMSDEQQQATAQALLDKIPAPVQSDGTEGFNPDAEMWADYARSNIDPIRRAKMFTDFRHQYEKDPVALRSFTSERECLRAKRIIWDPITWQVKDRVFDDELGA